MIQYGSPDQKQKDHDRDCRKKKHQQNRKNPSYNTEGWEIGLKNRKIADFIYDFADFKN